MPKEFEVQSINQRKNIDERRAVKEIEYKNDMILDNTSQINSNVAQIKKEINNNINSKIEEIKNTINDSPTTVSSESDSQVIGLLENILNELENVKEKTNTLSEEIVEMKEGINQVIE